MITQARIVTSDIPRYNSDAIILTTQRVVQSQLDSLGQITFKQKESGEFKSLEESIIKAQALPKKLEEFSLSDISDQSVAQLAVIAWELFSPAFSPFNEHRLQILSRGNATPKVNKRLLLIILETLIMAHRSIAWGGSIECTIGGQKECAIAISIKGTEWIELGELHDNDSVASSMVSIENAISELNGSICSDINLPLADGVYETIWEITLPEVE